MGEDIKEDLCLYYKDENGIICKVEDLVMVTLNEEEEEGDDE